MKLGTMLADRARRYPGREAMVCGDRRVTFAELDTRASRPANALPAKGQAFGDDDLVIGYTSGTTGNPKGAVNTHRNPIFVNGFMNSIEWGLARTDRTVETTPMAHRTGLGRVTNMPCLGSSLVILPRFDPAEAVDLIEREGCTVIGVVPTIARPMLPEIERRPQACRTLQKMLATGEAFPVEVRQRLAAALPELGIHGFHAQTESGFIASPRPEEQLDHGESCGRVVPGVEIRIVDGDLDDVADGEAESGVTAGADELIEQCRTRIASDKKPKHVRFIDDLPRTGTGKARKQELRRLAAAERDSAPAGGREWNCC